MANSPYDLAPDRSFWWRAVARQFEAADLLPPGTVLLRSGDRVMSAGSCFAANIVPHLERSGFAYVRTETRPSFLSVAPENLGYDNFSAAYGNIYTARQLRQLVQRCEGLWQPGEHVWTEDDTFVDPFRPGLRYRARSARELELLTAQHLANVRRAFAEATVFVFTLGLTEAWVSRQDGAVFPACPGTVAGTFDADRHAFHNFRTSEVIADLDAVIEAVRRINPGLRIILTVSPVPLVATATGGHVLTASIYSKSVLRAAADEAARNHREVAYFPAYEIVTGPQAPEAFFEPDHRTVSRQAIETVMAALLAHCEGASATPPQPPDAQAVDTGPAPERSEWAAQRLSQMIVEAECEEMLSDPLATAG